MTTYCAPEYGPGRLLRLLHAALGLLFVQRGRHGTDLRFSWGSAHVPSRPRARFALSVESGLDDADRPRASFHVALFGLSLFVHAPAALAWEHADGLGECKGFSYGDRALHLNWKSAVRIVWMPWMWDHCRNDVMTRAGTFRPERRGHMKGYNAGDDDTTFPETPDAHGLRVEIARDLWQAVYPFRYDLDDGTTHETVARVHVTRQTWRLRALPWLPFPRRRRTYVSLHFAEPVGEGRGSWKGGVTACSHEMRRGETPHAAVVRMQAERRFRS